MRSELDLLPRILVTDGEERAALAIVRSLGAAGYPCLVGSLSGRSLAGATKWALEDIALPDPGANPLQYVEAIASVVEAKNVAAVIPVGEPSLLAVLSHRHLVPAHVPFPEVDIFKAACDKAHVLNTASSVGIRVPRQGEIPCPDSALPDNIQYPLVLKPTRSVFTTADGSRGKTQVQWVWEPVEFGPALAAYPPEAYPLLVQEAIAGPGIGVFVLIENGEVTASFFHRRVREKPPSGGVSVVRESVPPDPLLLERSVALLSRLSWSGVAMVEFKLDQSTEEAVLMEINGRFWGSLQLAIDAGVDFPCLLLQQLWRPPAVPHPVVSYRLVRSRWFWGDTDHLIAVWRDPGLGAIAKLRAAASWIRAFGPSYRPEVFRFTDPRPFFRESRYWLAGVVSR